MRVAVLGLTHDHVWSNLRNLAAVPGAGSSGGPAASSRWAAA
jgi:hypothetical protein